MLDDQVTAKICIPKIIFNICDVRKKRSDEVFLYITVCVFMGIFYVCNTVHSEHKMLTVQCVLCTQCSEH